MNKMSCMITLLFCFIAATLIAGCSTNGEAVMVPDTETVRDKLVVQDQGLGAETLSGPNLVIGSDTFAVELYGNPAVATLLNLFPMTITMKDMNSNEKYHYLPDPLPVDATSPGQIRAGDIMLYGDDCLVIFYEPFSTSYQYTPLGRIKNIDGLRDALDGDTVKVTFSVKREK